MRADELEAVLWVRSQYHHAQRFDDVRTVLNRLAMGLAWKTGDELAPELCTCTATDPGNVLVKVNGEEVHGPGFLLEEVAGCPEHDPPLTDLEVTCHGCENVHKLSERLRETRPDQCPGCGHGGWRAVLEPTGPPPKWVWCPSCGDRHMERARLTSGSGPAVCPVCGDHKSEPDPLEGE